MLTPRQLVAARGFLGWTRENLADEAGTSKDAVYAFEARGTSPRLETVQAWIHALHKAGVILQDEDENHGPGIRLRKGTAPAGRTKPRKRRR
jgi:predicted transcriptional regulator